jgi:hypothetical protein
MHRLPPPNWSAPPNHFNGDFMMPNMQPPRGAYGCVPFMPMYGPTNQPFAPRAPFHGELLNQHFYQQQQHSKTNNKV